MPLAAPSSAHADSLAPFLQVLRRLRQLTTPKAPEAHTPHAVRERFAADMRSLRLGFPIGQARDMTVPGAEGHTLPARLYKPASQPALPVLLVFFHGGGFIMGDLDTHDDACRVLCEASGMPVLSVAYRLAPEHPFPTPVQDGVAATQWALAHAAELGVQHVAVGGDSAGGCLAAVVAHAIAQQGLPLLAQLLIYPGTDRSQARASHQLYGNGYFLHASDRELFYGSYLKHDKALDLHPQASPMLAPVPANLAPTLMVTAGYDMLRDEGIAYAEHLAAHGIAVDTLHYARLGHAFINFVGVHGESLAAVRQIGQRLRQGCERRLPRVTTT